MQIGEISSVKLIKREFTKGLGFIRRSIVYFVLKNEFEDKKYPFIQSEVVDAERKRIAKKMLNMYGC